MDIAYKAIEDVREVYEYFRSHIGMRRRLTFGKSPMRMTRTEKDECCFRI